MPPVTRYAKSGDIHVAYQAFGEGDVDLVIAPGLVVRELLARFRGREIDTAGDGFLAAFDGPARAVRPPLFPSAASWSRSCLAGLGAR